MTLSLRALRAVAVSSVVGAGALTHEGPAFAEPASAAPAAEDLFQRAKKLMTSHDFTAACPLLVESYRLDRAGGTLQNLAVCYEELGKLASAYGRFQELRTVSKSATPPRLDRVRLADEHIAKLTPRLSRIVVLMPNTLAATAIVRIDGVTYERAAWSAGIVVDRGFLELVVSAPGKRPYRTRVNAPREGQSEDVSVPELEDQPEATAPAPDPKDASIPTERVTGFVVGGIGLAALATGTVFGVLAFTANQAGRDKCSAGTNPGAKPDNFDPASGTCFADSAARTDANASKDDARTFANVANVLVPVGVVGLGVGAYLVFIHSARTPVRAGTKETRSARRVLVTPSLSGMSIEGRF